MSFASVLDSYCNATGCTNKEIAEKCGLSPSVLSRYRNGDRAPEIDSSVIKRLAVGIAELSRERRADSAWRQDIVHSALESALPGTRPLGLSYGARVSAVMTLLKMRNSEVAAIMGVSPSYISRIRNDQRAPSGKRELAEKFAWAAARRSAELGRETKLVELINSGLGIGSELQEASPSQPQIVDAVVRWLQGNNICELDVAALEGLFKKIDEFYYEGVLDDINKLELPHQKNVSSDAFSRMYSGLEGMGEAEVEFFQIAAACNVRHVYLNNDMPLLETTLNPDFARVYQVLIGTLVRGGTHFTVVHTVDRPLVETLIVLDLWFPLFVSGYATPYYLTGTCNRLFSHETFVCKACALSAEAVMGHQADGRCHLTTNPNDVAYYQQKMNFILEHASSLLDVYRDSDPKQQKAFSEFRAACDRRSDGRIVGADRYKNLHIVSYPDDCAIVTIASDPAIHLVIRHPQLCYVISNMR